MKHYIYSVHAVGGSRYSKGYSEYYLTDRPFPTAENPVKSVVVLQIGETEEVFIETINALRPSDVITIRLCRATYNDTMEISQCGYIFITDKHDIPKLIMDCCADVDTTVIADIVKNGVSKMSVEDPNYIEWVCPRGKS